MQLGKEKQTQDTDAEIELMKANQTESSNRLAKVSPRQYTREVLEKSEKYRTYQFSPRISKKSNDIVSKLIEDGKWNDINTIYDHLNKDTELRVQKMAQKLIQKEIKQESVAKSGISSVNVKSTLMISQKFSREFQQAVMILTMEGKYLQKKEQIEESEVLSCYMDMNECRNVLFCLGFTKAISSADDEYVHGLWHMLTQETSEDKRLLANMDSLKCQSLYNFLCYLQSLESAVAYPEEFSSDISLDFTLNRFGIIYNGVFYLNINND